MTILVLGINHNTAPLEIRERVAFAPERLEAALRDAGAVAPEIAILSTCNRTELYAAGLDDYPRLLQWLSEFHHVDSDSLRASHYCLRDLDALRHMMRVASGLDSMVLGEPQILGQIKSAYAAAREAGTVSGRLNQVFQQAFATAKRVRTETAIGQNPVSVAYAAVSLAQQIFSDLSSVKTLLIGAGDTVELVARHLREKGVGDITVANRTLSRAVELGGPLGAKAILLSEIPEHLCDADIVISSTASQLPILGKGAVESALGQRRHRPIFMVDIAVPRDIEPEVDKLDDVYLYTVDDLKDVIEENLRSRETAADKAGEIIEEGVAAWQRQLRAQEAVGTIRAFRQSVEEIRDAELERAVRALQNGQDPEAVLKSLAKSLTNKLLHTPTTRLKQAGEEGREEHIRWTHELFDLGDGDTDKSSDKGNL